MSTEERKILVDELIYKLGLKQKEVLNYYGQPRFVGYDRTYNNNCYHGYISINEEMTSFYFDISIRDHTGDRFIGKIIIDDPCLFLDYIRLLQTHHKFSLIS